MAVSFRRLAACSMASMAPIASANQRRDIGGRMLVGGAVDAPAGAIASGEVGGKQGEYMRNEHCILLDLEDNVVGSETKFNCHRIDHPSFKVPHRAFSVFLFNQEGKLLLQQRSAAKITFPLVWTNTCCSHPLHREAEMEQKEFIGAKRAAARKLEDELGIAESGLKPAEDFTFLTRIHYQAPSGGGWGEHEIDYILFMRGEPAMEPNPEEVAAVKWVDREELRALVAEAEKPGSNTVLSPWFKLMVDNFLYKWWDHLDAGTLAEIQEKDTIHRL